MKALQYQAFGDLDQLAISEIPEPHVAEGQVRVHVTAVGLNPMDWLIMGTPPLAAQFGVHLPAIFAYDFAGVIDEVGKHVTDFVQGDRVFGTTYAGAAAEYITVDADVQTRNRLFHTPDGLSDEIAATLGVCGLTAAVALRTIKISEADTVVIGGAAGGVGVFAVQLAKLAGATVIGTASDHTANFLQQLGAEQVRYGEGLKERLADKNITAVMDLVNQDTLPIGLALGIKPEKMTTIIMFPEPPAGIARSTGGAGTVQDMQYILEALVAGKMTVPIAATFPLIAYREAIELQKSRHVHGKIVITL